VLECQSYLLEKGALTYDEANDFLDSDDERDDESDYESEFNLSESSLD
jgi:hypothetical protein